jgi:hypothetical protein
MQQATPREEAQVLRDALSRATRAGGQQVSVAADLRPNEGLIKMLSKKEENLTSHFSDQGGFGMQPQWLL